MSVWMILDVAYTIVFCYLEEDFFSRTRIGVLHTDLIAAAMQDEALVTSQGFLFPIKWLIKG